MHPFFAIAIAIRFIEKNHNRKKNHRCECTLNLGHLNLIRATNSCLPLDHIGHLLLNLKDIPDLSTALVEETNALHVWNMLLFPLLVVCGQDKQDETGVIESPNFPNNYPHHRNCEWRITIENGRQILLNVTSFNVELHTGCEYDYLEIRYGRTWPTE